LPGASKQNGPEGPFCSVRYLEALLPGLTLPVDGNCGSGGSGHLNAMLLTPEVVVDVPVLGLSLAGYVSATLDVLRIRLLSVVAADIGAHRGSRDSATGSREILSASATNLMAQNAADDRAGNRTGNVGVASILDDLFALDPASLLGWSDHRAD
jgi:hypothetical protein